MSTWTSRSEAIGVHEVKVHLFLDVDPIISVEVPASPE